MMVTLLLVCLIYGALGDQQDNASISNNWFKEAIENLKTVLKNGDSSLNIPQLDPLYIDRKFSWGNSSDDKYFSFSGSVSGFSDYTVNSGDLNSALNTTMNLTFSQINIIGEYALNASVIEILPLQGSGGIITSVNGLKVSVNASFKPGGGVMRLTDFTFTYDYDSFPMQITGVLSQFNVGDTLNHILQDAVPVIVQKYSGVLGAVASNVAKTRGTSFLEGLNIDKIIEIVKEWI